MVDSDEILTTREAARLLKVSTKTLERMRVEGTGPAFYKAGRAVRYRMQDLLAWLEAHKFTSTTQVKQEETRHDAF